MRSRVVGLVWAAVLVCAVQGTARAADLSLGRWSWGYDGRARFEFAAPVTNSGASHSGPIVVTLWATTDNPAGGVLTQGYRLAEVVVEEGLQAGEFRIVDTEPQAQIEEPVAGSYFLAVTVDEDAFDAAPRLVSILDDPLSFPLPEAPTQAEIRRRVASAIPCGGLFVQFSLVTFVGLCVMKWLGPRAGRGR